MSFFNYHNVLFAKRLNSCHLGVNKGMWYYKILKLKQFCAKTYQSASNKTHPSLFIP